MADSDHPRSHRPFDPQREHLGEDGAYRSGGGDPLAELARLIGQSDPFAEFERNYRVRDARGAEAQPSAHVAPPPIHPHSESYGAAGEPQPYAAVTEQDSAMAYAQYPDQHSEQAYGYAADAYAQGYDPYYDPNSHALDEAEYYEQQERKRRQRRLAMVAAILALAVFGGAGAYGYRTFFGPAVHASPPPVIKADTTPTKVLPTQATDRASNKQIYDRVGERTRTERIVPREEKPVDIKTASVSPAPRAASPTPDMNIVASPPPATIPVTRQSTGGDVLPVAATPSIVQQGTGAILPSAKKVRTVTIRPDMTVVPNESPGRSEPAPPPSPATRSVEPSAQPSATRSAAPPPIVAPPANGVTRSVAPPARQSSGPLSLTPEGVSSPPPPQARTAAQPLALAAAPPAASAEPRASGNYAVQVSSQRSEAEANASYQALQARYPSVLGGRSSFVRRADLGSRGIYYRTMVGPFATAEEAGQFCTALKAAGGQCLIHRN